MGYYSMVLSMLSRKYFVIVLPWRPYKYTALHVGLTISLDMFQLSMIGLFCYLAKVCVYVDNIIVLCSDTFKAHMKDVEEVIWRLKEMRIQVNLRKTDWALEKVDYLTLALLLLEKVKSQQNKIQAILNIQDPTNKRDARRFVGLVNSLKNLYQGRSKTLASLTTLTGNGLDFLWSKECNNLFASMKAIMAEEVLVSLSKYGEFFEIHTDTSDPQIRRINTQHGNSLAYFQRNLMLYRGNTRQRNRSY